MSAGRLPALLLSALLSATSSAIIYVAFLLLWVHSQDFNGREPAGAATIWAGLLSAGYGASIGGTCARGHARVFIVASSAITGFLWLLAMAASAAV
jgi:hypothetical protein